MRFNNIKLHASDTRVEEKMRKKIMEEKKNIVII